MLIFFFLKSSKLSKENIVFWLSVLFLSYVIDKQTVFQIVEEDGSLLEIGMVLYSMLPDHLYIYRGFKGAVSRQSSSFCLILPITRPQSLWNLK